MPLWFWRPVLPSVHFLVHLMPQGERPPSTTKMVQLARWAVSKSTTSLAAQAPLQDPLLQQGVQDAYLSMSQMPRDSSSLSWMGTEGLKWPSRPAVQLPGISQMRKKPRMWSIL